MASVLRSFLGILALAFCLAAGQTKVAIPGSSYVIGPNDRVIVRCLNADEFTASPMRVDGDGHVMLPFIGSVKLAGLTVSGAENTIARRLSQFILHPQVSLNVVESHSQPVSVLGAVSNPGTYQLEGEKSLSEVLSSAGGLRKDAGPILKITRRSQWGDLPLPSAVKDPSGEFSVADVDLDDLLGGRSAAMNLAIRPYDVISVPQAEIVYVVGQVRKPGGFTITGHDGLSVLQVLSMAEGLDRMAAPKKARILRRSAGQDRVDIAVNLDTILSGKARDVVLQPNDVLFVPSNMAKSAGTKTLDTVIQAATGIVIYGRY